MKPSAYTPVPGRVFFQEQFLKVSQSFRVGEGSVQDGLEFFKLLQDVGCVENDVQLSVLKEKESR